MCHVIHQYEYAKTNNKSNKNYYKNKKSLYLKYWDINKLYGWAMSERLPLCGFKWTKETSQIIEDFIKNYNNENADTCSKLS